MYFPIDEKDNLCPYTEILPYNGVPNVELLNQKEMRENIFLYVYWTLYF